MKKAFYLIFCIVLWAVPRFLFAQNQTVISGQNTVSIPLGTGCNYIWTNNNPGIGLPATGSGDIPSFKAINATTTPITATITAIPTIPTQGNAYVANYGSSNVGIIDVVTKQLKGTLPVGPGPAYITTNAITKRVYVSNSNSNTVSVINGANNTNVTDITVGSKPLGLAVNADGTMLYVANALSNTVSVINAGNNQVVKILNVGTYPTDVKFSPDGSLIYVTNNTSSSITVINPFSNMVVRTVNVGAIHPSDMVVTADGKFLYVTSQYGFYAIETTNLTIVGSIGTVQAALGITMHPDGSKVYVTGNGSGNSVVYVINTASYSFTSIPIGPALEGLCISPDGSQLYVANTGASELTIIDTKTNTITDHVATGGAGTGSFGDFFLPASPCPDVTYTIKVSPVPLLSVGAVTGSISACRGTDPSNQSIQKFVITGSGLTGDVVLTASTGFEISSNPTTNYVGTISLKPAADETVSSTIYIRAAADAPNGKITGAVTITAPGISSRTVNVSGMVYDAPSVDPVANQSFRGGTVTAPVNFTGLADSYTWVNNNPAIGLPANGAGNIPAFTAVNNTNAPITATITVQPALSGSPCAGTPATFTITIRPASDPFIYTSSIISTSSTTYGTPGPAASFTVTGSNLASGITVKPPAGFEVSADNISFSASLTLSASANGPVYVRLTKTTNAGNYNGDILLSSSGAADAAVNIPLSLVNQAPLTVFAQNSSKKYGETLAANPSSTLFTSTALQNSETIGGVNVDYDVAGKPNTPVGTYAGSVAVSSAGGGTFNPANYDIKYVKADAVIDKVPLVITARGQTRFYGAVNPPLTVDYNTFVNNETAAVLTAQPVVTTTADVSSPVGQYPITVAGAASPNYDIALVDGVLTINALPLKVVVPTAFTPNGDAVNDLWDISALKSYPLCTVNIFSRSGEKVFQSAGYGKAWDGTYNGAKLPAGTYYYLIDLRNGTPVLSGNVSILR